ncbi:diaminohydroxyphosphoribosylaminopyrimidine deaminase [Alkalithermobacter thermoalcaliphilus JW-YL-7 = DSM 7308]|uniref:Riboflavin biosynthesis protein RibD n=1 Tax=Alkalithermobacter thermoalcaliphilus JW-YL-7 = DSM 7308 TaxID=1121328 RepID=A0A150FSV3_CLOPD|nr:riboflavin biosynthesis protein RibD [[Clostridium] paradoxum JW-YL-7 = DSM 7308]SHL18640.1 diaminohydroxyphosphoribosylaminopyrimidine deaminase [[Clostridium] paradoxum JW-YL-7 = DSM 7308]
MDYKYMKKALSLAKLGIGYTNPNPLVGAVIVKDGQIIGQGYHKHYGYDHAEIDAIKNSYSDLKGSTMYVNLEPCSHFGKTPPCVYEIVKKGISKVVIGMVDPNPLVSGNGIKILKENNIEVVVGVLEDEAKKLNEIFIKYITTNIPFCILKTAMTLDGKIASKTGDSKWISNDISRKYVHHLRHKVSAIMVGVNTVILDNPYLTTRLNKRSKNPIRIIVDTYCKTPLDSNVLSDESKTIIATTNLALDENIEKLKQKGAEIIITPAKDDKVDLSFLMKELGKRKIDSILLEGGSTLNYTALNENLVDKVISFVSAKIIGGTLAKTPVGGLGKDYIKDAIELENVTVSMFDNDIMIQAYPKKV